MKQDKENRYAALTKTKAEKARYKDLLAVA